MRRRDRYTAYLATLTMVVAAFAIGGATRWTALLAAALAAVTLAPLVKSRREATSLSPLLMFLGAGFALTLLQLLPLPLAVVKLLSPAKASLVTENAAALAVSAPGWTALSVDPASTLIELAKLAGYTAFAYTCLRIATGDRGKRWLAATIAVTGAAMATTAIVHELSGAQLLFGLYEPQKVSPFMAPLLNPNHLAALLVLATPVAIGLAVASPFKERVAWIGVATLCAGVCLLTQSRGGAVALVIGLVSSAILYVIQVRRGAQTRRGHSTADKVAIAITALSMLLLFGLLTAGGAMRELRGTQSSEVTGAHGKIATWKASKVLLRDYRWTGVGRGAFEPAFTKAQVNPKFTSSHLENEYLQAVVDWGIPGAAALALLLVMVALAAVRRSQRTPLSAGAIGGLLAVALQNTVDFSLSMPGVVFPVLAATAILVAVPVSTDKRQWLRGARIAGGVVVLAIVALAASPLGTPSRARTQSLQERLAAGSEPHTLLDDAISVLDDHPSDYVAAGLVAKVLFMAQDPRAVAVANRALIMHPRHAGLHHLTATMLNASQRPQQALIEYSLAIQYAEDRDRLVDEVLARFVRPEDAVRALPLEHNLLDRIFKLLRARKRTDVMRLYLERFTVAHPKSQTAFLRLAALNTEQGDHEDAVRAAREAYGLAASAEATSALADSLTATGASDEALALLREAASRSSYTNAARVTLMVSLSHAELTAGDAVRARSILHEALDLGGDLALVHAKLAEVEEKLGNRHQAEWERRKARDLRQSRLNSSK